MTTNTTTLEPGITIQRDVVFNQDTRRPLTLHLLRPEAPSAGPRPVVVWVFGGAFRRGDKDSGLPHLLPFVRRGYVGAAIEYRYSSEALFPAQIQDCKCAIRFLRANHAAFGLDPDRIGVWGPSAGGHLSTMLGVTAGVPEFEGTGGWSDYSSQVQAVCDWFGPTDFLQMNRAGSSQDHDAADSPESELIGGPIQENPDKARSANPITYITPGRVIPPFLIVHGDLDPLVPFNQSELLVAALEAAGVDYRFHRVVGGGHGGPLFETAEVRSMVDAFFEERLGSQL